MYRDWLCSLDTLLILTVLTMEKIWISWINNPCSVCLPLTDKEKQDLTAETCPGTIHPLMLLELARHSKLGIDVFQLDISHSTEHPYWIRPLLWPWSIKAKTRAHPNHVWTQTQHEHFKTPSLSSIPPLMTNICKHWYFSNYNFNSSLYFPSFRWDLLRLSIRIISISTQYRSKIKICFPKYFPKATKTNPNVLSIYLSIEYSPRDMLEYCCCC